MARKGGASALKEPEVVDVQTGEVLTTEAQTGRLRGILAKQAEIEGAEKAVEEQDKEVKLKEQELKDAEDEMDARKEIVRNHERDLRDLIRGQKLLFE